MARIVMADDGVAFDGRSPDLRPLGGAETAFVRVAAALAARNHEVQAFSRGGETFQHDGVRWAPVTETLPDAADLYIANRGDKLLRLVPKARRVAFWLHNDARYVMKWRYLAKILFRQPALVFVSRFHAATLPRWAPGGPRVVIPLAADRMFHGVPREAVPPPVAIFASNPQRGLGEILDLWGARVRAVLPDATLRLYAGLNLYGGPTRAAPAHGSGPALAAILDRARAAADQGVVLHDMLARPALALALLHARVMLYPGDPAETFCLAVAEAQAAGVPCVVYARGALPERVTDGVTGFVARDAAGFAAAAVRLMSDSELWRRHHLAALAAARRTWDDVAADFEKLIG